MTIRWVIARIVLTIIDKVFFGIKIQGRKNIPEGAVIFASNHRSHLDPPAIGYAVHREVHFIAKEDLFHIRRLFTWLIEYFNAISIRRGGDLKALRKTLSVLKNSGAIIIFPEGTRSKTDQLLPFQKGVGLVALKSRVPVIPTYIKNSDAPIIDIITRKKRLEIFFAKPFIPNGFPSNKIGYNKFTKELRNRVVALRNECNNR